MFEHFARSGFHVGHFAPRLPSGIVRGVTTLCALLFLCLSPCLSQQPGSNASIRVQADQSVGPLTPIWNYFAGVRGQPDVNAITTRKDHEIEILVWNYHDDQLPITPTAIDLTVSGLPANAGQASLEHFRIDSNHSNAFTAWKDIGSPQSPTAHQYEMLESAGQLQLLGSPSWLPIEIGGAHLQFTLPREGLSLIRVGWQ